MPSTSIVVVFGVAVGLVGSIGVVRPTGLVRFVETMWQSPTGFRLAIALRLVLGVVLIVAAPDCRFPQVIRILGIFSLVAAAATAALGHKRLRSFVQWWVGRPLGFVRCWSLVAVAFGCILVYAAF
jgi:NAD/NADP transhydrogenase beta subunit